MIVLPGTNTTLFCQRILYPLLLETRYFSRTLKKVSVGYSDEAFPVLRLLPQIRSIEEVLMGWPEQVSTISLVKSLPLRSLTIAAPSSEYELVDEDEEVADAFSSQFTDSDSVIKNTLETFFAVKLENISFLRSFQKNLHSLTLMGYGEIDISPIGSLYKLQKLVINSYNNVVVSKDHYDSIEDCLSELPELRWLDIDTATVSTFDFLKSMPKVEHVEICFHVEKGSKEADESVEALATRMRKDFTFIGENSHLRALIIPWTHCMPERTTQKISVSTVVSTAMLEGLILSNNTSSTSSNSSASSALTKIRMRELTFSPQGLSLLHKISRTLKVLTLYSVAFVEGTCFFDLLSVLDNLEEFSFSPLRGFLDVYSSCFSPLCKLKKLELIHCRIHSEDFCEKLFTSAPTLLESLEELRFQSVTFEFDGWMRFFANLQKLRVLHCPRSYSGNWEHEMAHIKEQHDGAAFGGSLEELSFQYPGERFDDDALDIISSKLPFLRRLKISGDDTGITALGVGSFLSKLKNLDTLEIGIANLTEREKNLIRKSFHKSCDVQFDERI